MARSAPALALVFIVSAGQAYAADPCPKMSVSDMDEQWQRNATRSSAKHFTLGDQLECVSIQVGTAPLVCHTKPGAPAHPSILLLRILLRGGSVETRTDGYTAGDCSAFQDMMLKFRNGMTMQEHRTSNQPSFDPVP
jgi:hypothetical protein